jgi:hypothetical protein
LLTSYVTGIAVIVAVSLGWVAVQLAWRKAFPEFSGDPDALAGRMGCHGCSCTDVCEKRPSEPSDPAEEETT